LTAVRARSSVSRACGCIPILTARIDLQETLDKSAVPEARKALVLSRRNAIVIE
jgi:hypothetical protein